MTPTTPLRIFIGWDAREAVAYHVLSHSILSRATCPVSITPLKREHLTGIYTRPRSATESTDFSLTRFLVPYLCHYEGRAIFMDCDMLCLGDIGEITHAINRRADAAVLCCQHQYEPKDTTKFLGEPQHKYRRKNWSSVMVFNNARCEYLTPYYVNKAPGLELHQFDWLSCGQCGVGPLPLEWNHLVGEYDPNPKAKLLHFTRGGPWFDGYRDCEYADLWRAERDQAFGALMMETV